MNTVIKATLRNISLNEGYNQKEIYILKITTGLY